MRFLRRFGGALVLILSSVGTVGCVAGVIAIWVVDRKASERVATVATRLDDGLQRASAANHNVQRAVGKARTEVAEVRKESADLGKGGEKSRRSSRALRAMIQKQVGPDMENLGGRLATLSDAAVALSSLLQGFQELPPGGISRLNPEEVEQWQNQVERLTTSLRRLEAVVGDGDKQSSDQEVAAEANQVGLVLQKCQAKVEAWQSKLDGAREDLAHAKTKILGWLKLAAIAGTFLGLWMAAGQVSLFAHAWRWYQGRGSGVAGTPPESLVTGQPVQPAQAD